MNRISVISFILLALASLGWLVQSAFAMPMLDFLFVYAGWLFWQRSQSSPYLMGGLSVWMDIVMGTPLGSQGLIMILIDWVINKHRSEQLFVWHTGLAALVLLTVRICLLMPVISEHSWTWILLLFVQDVGMIGWCCAKRSSIG